MDQRAGRETLPESYRFTAARAAAFVPVAIGVVVISAWLIAKQPVRPLTDATYGMSFNGATTLLLCGLSVLASLSQDARFRRLSGFLVLLPLFLALAHVLDYATSTPLGVGKIFSHLFVRPELLDDFKGGMAPNTSVAVIVFCATQIYIAFLSRGPDALALTTGGMVASGLGLTSLVGYVSGLEDLYHWRDFPPMAFHMATGIWLLGTALLIQARHPLLQQSSRLHFTVTSLLCVAGLVLDLSTPPFVGSNIIYVPVVLTAIWFVDRRIAFCLAVICALFSLLAYVAKVEYHDDHHQRLIARALGIATLFIVAALVYHFKTAMQKSEDGRFAFDVLMDNSPDAVVTINDRGLIQQFNPAAEAMFGYREQDLVGKNLNFLMTEPFHADRDAYLAHQQETGDKRIIGTIREVSGQRSDGSVFPMDLSISVLSSGRRGRFVGILRDLSSRKKQEDTLRQALNRLGAYAADLERSNQELDEFAYIASHDLKEPLRGLHNHSRFLLEDYDAILDADGKRRLNRLVYLSQRMEKLVNDLLYFSRIGRQELAVQETDVNVVIRDILVTSEHFLEENHARVLINGPLPTITVDAVRITEVFRNLIVNAVKYNDKPEKIVEIGFLDSETDDAGKPMRKVFYVRDNGKGIAPEFYQDIFRIFKRLEKAETEGEGTGVGLTFVRKIIARHGGKIWPRSELGIGTTFFFTLTMEQE
jgi:PAS domain S-box-containing protein